MCDIRVCLKKSCATATCRSNGPLYTVKSTASLLVTMSVWPGKDYSGAKFFYAEPIFLNKAHSTK